MDTSDGTLSQAQLERELFARADRMRAFIESRIPPRFRASIAAEDVLQDVWINAFRALPRFRMLGPDSLDRWLHTITRTRLLEVLRDRRAVKRGGRERFLDADARLATSLDDLFACVAGVGHTPSSDAAIREARQFLQSNLERLTVDRRTAIALQYFDGLTRRQIAERMGVTEAPVNTLISQGINERRSYLGDAARFFSDTRSADAPAQ